MFYLDSPFGASGLANTVKNIVKNTVPLAFMPKPMGRGSSVGWGAPKDQFSGSNTRHMSSGRRGECDLIGPR